ncbi:MAG: hypothetical protein Q8K37_04845 [Alphaproteobacteria bacterium]|nr:hypothetical protein [Alphaproteobacteria bacterium]
MKKLLLVPILFASCIFSNAHAEDCPTKLTHDDLRAIANNQKKGMTPGDKGFSDPVQKGTSSAYTDPKFAGVSLHESNDGSVIKYCSYEYSGKLTKREFRFDFWLADKKPF